jgi:hypothetical protein
MRLLPRNGWDYDSDDESDDGSLPALIPKNCTDPDDESDDVSIIEDPLDLFEDTHDSKLAAACALLGIHFDTTNDLVFMASSATETNKKYDDLCGLDSWTTTHVPNREDGMTDRCASNK